MLVNRIRGLETVFANMAALPKALQQKALAPALRKGAVIFRDEVRALAPRRSGRLVANVVISMDRNPKPLGMDVRFVIFVRYKGETAAFYWRYSEFGSSKQRAKPFMRPAFDLKNREALQVIIQHIVNALPAITANFRK